MQFRGDADRKASSRQRDGDREDAKRAGKQAREQKEKEHEQEKNGEKKRKMPCGTPTPRTDDNSAQGAL